MRKKYAVNLPSSHDRLAFVMQNKNTVSLVGFRPSKTEEKADLENGFPCSGRWTMDYVDTFHESNAFEYARNVADGMWGTVCTDEGEILSDSLLVWTETYLDDEHFMWGLLDSSEYIKLCEQAYVEK